MNYEMLKEEMSKKGITYEEMANYLNISVSTFYRKIGHLGSRPSERTK